MTRDLPAPAPAPDASAEVGATVNLLAVASFFSGAAIRICDGLLPRLSSDFSTTPGSAGRVILGFALAYGISQLAFGPLGDRYGKARVICGALFASAATALACALASGFDVLVVLRVLWGVTAGGVIPLSMAWIGDTVGYEHRQATLARLLMGTVSGMMAGQLAGGIFADLSVGWQGAFGLLSAGYLLVAVLLLKRLSRIPAAVPSRGSGPFAVFTQVKSILSLPWPRVVICVAMAEGIFLLGPLGFLPSYLHQRFGIALSGASILVSLFGLGGVLYTFVAKHLVRVMGERRMVLLGGVLMGVGFLAWYGSPSAWPAGPVAMGVGFGTYLFHNTLQTHSTQMAPAIRGTGVALFAFSLFCGQALGTALAGYAYDYAGAVPLLLVPAVVLPLTCWSFARGIVQRSQQTT